MSHVSEKAFRAAKDMAAALEVYSLASAASDRLEMRRLYEAARAAWTLADRELRAEFEGHTVPVGVHLEGRASEF